MAPHEIRVGASQHGDACAGRRAKQRQGDVNEYAAAKELGAEEQRDVDYVASERQARDNKKCHLGAQRVFHFDSLAELKNCCSFETAEPPELTQAKFCRNSPIDRMHQTSVAPLHILVADDVPVNLRVAAVLLKGMGHRGVLVTDGQQALRALEQQHFDLVLMDASMPVLDGVGALQEIRAAEQRGRPHIPVIIVSGHVMPEDRERFFNAGADGFIAKPIQRETLQRELQRVLSL